MYHYNCPQVLLDLYRDSIKETLEKHYGTQSEKIESWCHQVTSLNSYSVCRESKSRWVSGRPNRKALTDGTLSALVEIHDRECPVGFTKTTIKILKRKVELAIESFIQKVKRHSDYIDRRD